MCVCGGGWGVGGGVFFFLLFLSPYFTEGQNKCHNHSATPENDCSWEESETYHPTTRWIRREGEKQKKKRKKFRGKNSEISRVGPLLFRFVISVMPPTYFVTILFLLQHSTTQIHDSLVPLNSLEKQNYWLKKK